MNSWQIFYKTGKIADYLNYCKERDSSEGEAKDADND